MTMLSAKPRARDLGIPFDGDVGQNNAITDVDGVFVGHAETGSPNGSPIQTGVTAVLPRKNDNQAGVGHGIDTFVTAAWYSLNGSGEMTGTTWIEESGLLEGPIMLTNTASVGTVRDALIAYSIGQQKARRPQDVDPDSFGLLLPVVAETYDGWLNDILGFHVSPEMVKDAIDGAAQGPVPEGNVGGGTGMTCYDWKGGIGTSSRIAYLYQVDDPSKRWGPSSGYKVGVLVQANQGTFWDLVIRGVPVGAYLTPPMSPDERPGQSTPRSARTTPPRPIRKSRKSSIIVVMATDAPLLPHQLKRLARRAAHGIARTGTVTNNDSGELVLAFSTANPDTASADQEVSLSMIPNDNLDPMFEAAVQATEEAIINAMIAAETVTGRASHTATRILDASTPSLLDVMKRFNRLGQPTN
jgi:D-aminopeptidase